MLKRAMVLGGLLLVGCSEASSDPLDAEAQPAEVTPTAALVVETDDGRVFQGTALAITVASDADPPVQVSLSGQDERGARWAALFGASLESLATGQLNATLERRPLAAGVGIVSERETDEPEAVEGGTIELKLADKRVSGVALTVPARSSATVDGRYVLTCWVEPEALGREPNGHGEGVREKLQDVSFETPFCQQFAAWR